jgi:hypothetical protein
MKNVKYQIAVFSILAVCGFSQNASADMTIRIMEHRVDYMKPKVDRELRCEQGVRDKIADLESRHLISETSPILQVIDAVGAGECQNEISGGQGVLHPHLSIFMKPSALAEEMLHKSRAMLIAAYKIRHSDYRVPIADRALVDELISPAGRRYLATQFDGVSDDQIRGLLKETNTATASAAGYVDVHRLRNGNVTLGN